MTSPLPPRVNPRTPREPASPERPERSEGQQLGRPARPDRDGPERRGAPPREFGQSKREMIRSFAKIRREWTAGNVGDKELEAFVAIASLAKSLTDGDITGEDALKSLP